MPLTVVYRAANNPFVDYLLLAVRRHGVGAEFISKGKAGARELLSAIEAGRHVGLFVDQKMNDGIPVPFFGRDAMTAPALARLALKSDRPIVPLRVERLRGATFRITVHPPLDVPRTGDREADVFNVMVRVNGILEAWIRQSPGQWFWVHDRWGDRRPSPNETSVPQGRRHRARAPLARVTRAGGGASSFRHRGNEERRVQPRVEPVDAPVQVRPGHPPGGAHGADDVALPNRPARADVDGTEVRQDGGHAEAVIYHHRAPGEVEVVRRQGDDARRPGCGRASRRRPRCRSRNGGAAARR